MLTKRSIVALAAAALVGSGAMPASPANATTNVSASMGSLPACVDIWHNSGWVTQTVYIKNTCSRRVGYVVEIAVIPDSHCIEVPRGKTKKYNWGKAWRWDGVHKCL